MRINKVTGLKFYKVFKKAYSNSKAIRLNCNLYSKKEYELFNCYLSSDNLSGYAITLENELINLFSLVIGRGKELVQEAIKHNANNLNCFDGYLFKLYSSNGFKTYRISKNWNKGKPNILYMKL